MTPNWTFGVELEFAIAETIPNTPHPDPSETRFTVFQTTDPYRGRLEQIQVLQNDAPDMIFPRPTSAVITHICETLTLAGFAASDSENDDISAWKVKRDASIKPPCEAEGWDRGYVWHRIEVVSPAYFFSPESLTAINKVCSLLTSTYCCNVNLSTGLHVHVGTGTQEGLSLDATRKLAALLWTFSPQLATLHPPDRQSYSQSASVMISGMREGSQLVVRRKRPDRTAATPLLGAAKILLAESMEEVLELVGGAENMRAVAYNFENLRPEPGTGLPIKGTVEFRQHAGSLDGPTITTWIQTVVGIVDFAHTIEPVPFNELLQTALANESWQMSYDGYDRQREETYGPILARERLTVIDLLRYMNLAGPASNYHARGLYFPFADSRPAPDGDRWKSEYQLAVEHGDRSHWRFENAMRDSCALGEGGFRVGENGFSVIGPERLERDRLLKEAFECLGRIERVQRSLGKGGRDSEVFDPQAGFWPVHDRCLDGDVRTDCEVEFDAGSEDSGSDFGDEWDGDVDSEDMSDEEVVEMRCAYIVNLLTEIRANDFKLLEFEAAAGKQLLACGLEGVDSSMVGLEAYSGGGTSIMA